jgi:putative transcriptional regulator
MFAMLTAPDRHRGQKIASQKAYTEFEMVRILTQLMIAACLLPGFAFADSSPAKGKLLVSTEVIRGDVFVETVILMLHYGDDGAAGIVVNRPTEVEASELVAEDHPMSGYDGTFYWGGPVQMDRLHVLLKTDAPPEDADKIVDSVYLVSLDEELMSAPADESRRRFFIGFAGWAPGQLDHELARGSWLVVPASDDIVFAKDPGGVWKRLAPRPEHRAAVASVR